MTIEEKKAKMGELCILRDFYENILNEIAEAEEKYMRVSDFVAGKMLDLDGIICALWTNIYEEIDQLDREWCEEDSNIDLY